LYELAVISGKGGTGKTLVATTLSAYFGWDYIDCDVEAPNGAFLLQPSWEESYEISVPIPEINQLACRHCGACIRFCRSRALTLSKSGVLLLPDLCHSCMGCELVCEAKAITRTERKIGVVKQGVAGEQIVWEGRLDTLEHITQPLIQKVKALSRKKGIRILDGPSGASCNSVETLRSVDYALLVAEPTRLGIQGFKATIELLQRLGIPAGVIINRSFGEEKEEELRAYIARRKLTLLSTIPFSESIARAYGQGDLQVLLDELQSSLKRWGDQIIERRSTANHEMGCD
jgi:MinD superfamily P-loop ATPase